MNSGFASSFQRASRRAHRLLCLALVVSASLLGAQAGARTFRLEAGDASHTLRQFATQAAEQIVFPAEAVRGITTNAVQGDFTPREALARMTAGTALVVIHDARTGALSVRREPVAEKKADGRPARDRAADAGAANGPRSSPAAEGRDSDATSRETAGSRGVVNGRALNAATGAYLEGATVTLQPGGETVLTRRDGSFSFPPLRPGNYQLSVSYTGLDSQTMAFSLAAGEAVTREISLTSEVYAMEAFTVAGEREGNALAVTQQRNAPNVKNVLSADAFGNIADQNLGNLLNQLPGIGAQIDEGEVFAVTVRGLSSELNAVTIDGTRAANTGPASGGGSRSFGIDRIPADFVERIEVTKALTPDMDGDSIGGAINLRTKSPLDRKGRTISFMGGASWNLDRNTFEPIGSVFYSNLLGQEEKLGVLVTASYNKTHKPRDDAYINWEPTLDTSRPNYFWVSNIGEDLLKHERAGLGLRFDYRLNASHRIFVNTLYSSFWNVLERRLQSIPTLAANRVRPGWTETVTETINHDLTFQQNWRDRKTRTVSSQLGGESALATSRLDYGFNYSRARQIEDITIADRIVAGVGFRFDRSAERRFPTVEQISGPAITDPNNGRISALNFRRFEDIDTVKGAQLNWRKEFSVAVPASIKTGLRYRGQKRDREQMRSYFTHVGADGVAGRNPATGINDDNLGRFYDASYQYRSDNGRYAPVTAIRRDLLMQDFAANPGHYPENVVNTARDGVQFDGSVSEDVGAAYVMGEVSLGQLGILAGVRVEDTRVASRGARREITPAELARRQAWVGPVTDAELRRRTIAEWSNIEENSGQYRSVLPSVHFKYHLPGGMLARASYSTGIGRPEYTDLLRVTTVNHDTMTVVTANQSLRPEYANSFDGSLEYYFEPAGFVSAGVFLKEISKFIFDDRSGTIGSGKDNGFEGEYAGYEVRMQSNGGTARVRGYELAYQQRFTRLPGAWQGLGLTANYTFLETKGNYGGSSEVTGTDLAGFTPRSLNLGLSYAYRSWDLRLKMNYRSRLLNTFSTNPAQRLYRFPVETYDCSAKYNVTRHLSVFVDVINIFNTGVSDSYVYVPDHNRFTQVFTTAIKAGISGRF